MIESGGGVTSMILDRGGLAGSQYHSTCTVTWPAAEVICHHKMHAWASISSPPPAAILHACMPNLSTYVKNSSMIVAKSHYIHRMLTPLTRLHWPSVGYRVCHSGEVPPSVWYNTLTLSVDHTQAYTDHEQAYSWLAVFDAEDV